MLMEGFSGEQTELMRRLRATGLRPDGLLRLFAQLERQDHHQTLHHPPPKRPPSPPRPRADLHAGPLDGPPPPKLQSLPRPREPSSVVTSSASANPVLLSHLLGAAGPREAGPPPLRARFPFGPSGALGGPVAEPVAEPSAYRPLRADADFSRTGHPAELRALLLDGEEAAIAEMKHFVARHQLRQTAVAAMSGVSQPYISKFLNGNFKELSQRVRTILFSWFVGAREKPEEMLASLAAKGGGGRMGGPAPGVLGGGWAAEAGRGAELLPQRRERYVFRPSLLRVLEAHFADNAYPDLERRMEISAECNRVLGVEKAAPLLPKELLTPQVVANWFANKRKEAKKRSGPTELLALAQAMAQQTPLAQAPLPQLHPMGTLPSDEAVGEGGPTPSGSPPDSEAESAAAQRPSSPLLKAFQSELDAVNSSLMALINPYGPNDQQ